MRLPLFRSPRHLQFVFIATMVLLSGVLGWFGWRVLQQDEQLSAQRLTERLDNAADLVVASLENRLRAIELDLGQQIEAGASPARDSRALRLAGDSGVVVEFLPASIRAWPEHRLTYDPVAAASSLAI